MFYLIPFFVRFFVEPDPPKTVAMSANTEGISPFARSVDAHRARLSQMSNAVSPTSSVLVKSAPNSRSETTVFLCPLTHAQCRGVLLNLSTSFMIDVELFFSFFLLKSKICSRIERLAPFRAATCNGVCPSSSRNCIKFDTKEEDDENSLKILSVSNADD